MAEPKPIDTAFTISLGSAQDGFDAARLNSQYTLIKVKLGRDDDAERLHAIRQAAPNVTLIADANESWDITRLRDMTDCLKACGVELVEQPLPEGGDEELRAADYPFHICADESFRNVEFLDVLNGRYDFINIKLDKIGGFTQGLRAARAAKERGVGVMVGCAVGSSLSLAPAVLIGQLAQYADLDGPLVLREDIKPSLTYLAGRGYPPAADLWG